MVYSDGTTQDIEIAKVTVIKSGYRKDIKVRFHNVRRETPTKTEYSVFAWSLD